MKNITIIGLGVIGGSFAKAIRENYQTSVNIYGIDTNATTLKIALSNGWIDKGETINQTILQMSDVVIFSIYPQMMKSFIQEHRDQFKNGAILTDTTGVKHSLINELVPLLPIEIDFIFGHPMAGREKRGIDYASSEVFKQANYILTPLPSNHPDNLNWLIKFIKSLGFKTVTQIDPTVHDQMIAYTSQLTHIISVALMNSDDHQRDTKNFVGDSFRELTRIANINEELWTELFFENKHFLIEEMTHFEQQFSLLKNALKNQQPEDMKHLLIQSARRRQAFEKAD